MNSTALIAGILIAGIVILFLQCIFIIGVLARIHASLQVLTQVVAVAIQRANLVRTEEEVEADMKEAQEQEESWSEELDAMKAETDDIVL